MQPFFLEPDIESSDKFKNLDQVSQESILSLRDHGFCVYRPAIDESILEGAIKDSVAKLEEINTPPENGEIFEPSHRIQDGFLFSDSIKEIACHKSIVGFLETAYGKNVFPFQTLNFKIGTQQATHSDTIHFNSFPYGFMCGAWLALEDVDADNGPLHYYPGSHKLPVFGMDQFGIHGADVEGYEYYNKYEEQLQVMIDRLALKKAVVNMKKGECLIWAANLLHGGEPINDESRTRLSQVTHYFFEDCLYYTPLLSSPFKNKHFIRRPFNVYTGKPITEKQQNSYAEKAGISIAEDHSNVIVKKKGLFSKIFG